MTPFRSIIEMIDTLHTENECSEYLETLLWGDAPVRPHCGAVDKEHWKLTSFDRLKGQYKCRYCRTRFNVRYGTMFEGTHIPLKKWFYAIIVKSLSIATIQENSPTANALLIAYVPQTKD